jgi:two-component system, NarL family, sensor histidine kinase DevS
MSSVVTSYTVQDIRALVEAGIALTSELSLDGILQKLVDVARRQVGARYAAISVLDENSEIAEFVTSGITQEERARIGHIPYGRGLLGVLLHEGTGLRLPDMAKDPRSGGFPPNHPPMKSLLGMPVVSRDVIIGNLYLTDKQQQEAFDERDEEIVRLLATQAAAAIETSRLREQLESLARLHERERIAMDLHDGVIQTVYAVTLHLEDAADRVSQTPDDVRPVLEQAIDSLHQVIKDIRSYIFDLRAQVSEVDDLPGAIRGLAETLRVNTLMDVQVNIDERVRESLERDQALGLFHIAQEALNNVSKHSQATAVSIELAAASGAIRLEVTDNGNGFDTEVAAGAERHGLRNIKDRARGMGARLSIDSKPGAGTRIEARIPNQKAKG